jgi:hypothetical protein
VSPAPGAATGRRGGLLVTVLLVLLAAGAASVVRGDGPAPEPLVATAADTDPAHAEVRRADAPPLGGPIPDALTAEAAVDRAVVDEELETAAPAADGGLVPLDLVVRAAPVHLDDLADTLSGAEHAVAATSLTATSPTGDDADREVTLLGVDGSGFRPLAPEVTAAEDGVWERLEDGDALVTHEVADALELELGGPLALQVGDAQLELRVGAFAANGSPPVADVLVPTAAVRELGAEVDDTLLVAAGADPEALGEALAEATGGDVELRRASAEPVPEEHTAAAASSGSIEPFSYTSHTDGSITIHGDWVERNIQRVELPGMPATSCHRAMVPQLFAAVDELIELELYDHLDPSQFAGCFVPRHIDRDPSRGLSMHAWGLAIDVNARDNPLGATPVMDQRVVEVFERWGFDWGGHWRRPDGMHFELARIVPTG